MNSEIINQIVENIFEQINRLSKDILFLRDNLFNIIEQIKQLVEVVKNIDTHSKIYQSQISNLERRIAELEKANKNRMGDF